MTQTGTITEADILDDLLAATQGDLTPEAARSVLALKFSLRTTRRIRQLLQKNNRGTIRADEQATLEKYLRVGQFLDLWQAKARLSLRQSGKAF
jgi:hypothetical protein